MRSGGRSIVDPVEIWEQVRTALGLDEPNAGSTVTRAAQIAFVVVVTILIAHWVSSLILRAAKTGRIYAEVAVLVSRAAALGIYALGVTVILAILSASWTAIAAFLGAATFGISLALQDVGRSFVNGVYLLIERPFRIGDNVRIGNAEGRVEDIGVRLITLRATAGERVIVPNTVVFSSTIEKSTQGSLDLQRFTVRGITRPIAEIQSAVVEALRGTPHLSYRTPVVAIVQATPEGTDIQVTVEQDLGQQVDALVIARLRDLFPEATIATSPSATGS
jgi:small-conductance mechanosensitive channel